MRGMDRQTGKWTNGLAHLRQSIHDLLTTTKGERLIVRDYGSNLFATIDRPLTDQLVLEIMSEVARVVHQFEPRIVLTKVGVVSKDALTDIALPGMTHHQNESLRSDLKSFRRVGQGHLTLKLEGSYENEAFVWEDITL